MYAIDSLAQFIPALFNPALLVGALFFWHYLFRYPCVISSLSFSFRVYLYLFLHHAPFCFYLAIILPLSGLHSTLPCLYLAFVMPSSNFILLLICLPSVSLPYLAFGLSLSYLGGDFDSVLSLLCLCFGVFILLLFCLNLAFCLPLPRFRLPLVLPVFLLFYLYTSLCILTLPYTFFSTLNSLPLFFP